MNKEAKKTILIVEDDSALRNVLKDKLMCENFTVLTAVDGEEGLKAALKNNPDLILLDIIMPKMNGVEMLKKLREDERGKTTPVLLLTNDSDPEHMRQSLKVNASDYLIKSDWELDDIVRKIKESIRR